MDANLPPEPEDLILIKGELWGFYGGGAVCMRLPDEHQPPLGENKMNAPKAKTNLCFRDAQVDESISDCPNKCYKPTQEKTLLQQVARMLLTNTQLELEAFVQQYQDSGWLGDDGLRARLLSKILYAAR